MSYWSVLKAAKKGAIKLENHVKRCRRCKAQLVCATHSRMLKKAMKDAEKAY